jgi:DNA-binding CsgD family transcriptional regulator
MARWDTSAIEAAFAAAATDASLWDAAMEKVAQIIPCVGAGMVPVHTHFPIMPHSAGVARLSHEYLSAGWHKQDQRYRGLPAMLRNGVTSEFDWVADVEELAKNPYYQEFLVPLGCPWFAGVKIATDSEVRCLTLQRSAALGPYSPSELRILAGLSRSLSSTAMFAQSLSFARAEAAMASFDASDTPIFLMNARAEVAHFNRSAERILGRDIKIVSRRLISWWRAATTELDQTLSALFLNLSPRASMPPVTLPRLDPNKRPLLAYAMRIPPVTADVFGACRGVIVISDLDQQPRPPENVLRHAFSLTPMEAKLARHIASGLSLDSAAELFGVNRETVRTHLKSVFSKTDTHRQAELIVMLSRLLDERR